MIGMGKCVSIFLIVPENVINLSATANLTVTWTYAPAIIVTFPVDPSVNRYEIHARSAEAGRRHIACGRGECSLSGLTPLAKYTLWLVTCGGAFPVKCRLLARPVDATMLPEGAQ